MARYISKLPSARFAETWPRHLALLGSTGSIGRSALAILERLPGHFKVEALAGGRNTRLLAAQALRWRPDYLAVQDEKSALELKRSLEGEPSFRPEILVGPPGYAGVAALPEVDLVLSAQSGAAGLNATYAAVRAGKVVALANKESLVLAGELIRKECGRNGASILPVDSEHNAVFQCLLGSPPAAEQFAGSAGPVGGESLKRIILTASGGPFRGWTAEAMSGVTPEEALAHPTWSMGAKISIDSATMMNKGMEIVEACHLYGLPAADVEVLIHPQSIIHALVEFKDSSRLAQLGVPDMRIPISCCLGWPGRMDSGAAELDLAAAPALSFFRPDEQNFPAPVYWRAALEEGKGLTVALNAANEVAVDLFLRKEIGFMDIIRLARLTLDNWRESSDPDNMEDVLCMDAKARAAATEYAARL
ncbi:MAG: 1-deoxy-D-xylulose-5-phosphate reductoisomerase [Deltaproteobacteria bacterium]|jgi:1-deoxy-D-xylulose-5-phosphate reductoisomerase|nr:1-deoxy-D-xylulose-5-phosphate reductoisomerase [Deltaproteobacteria bacterium]